MKSELWMTTPGQSAPAWRWTREDSVHADGRDRCASAHADQQTHTLVLTQQPPSLRPIDQGNPGASVADIVLYEAPISGEHGESGTLTGFLITADIPEAETGDLDADRLGQLSFDLGNGNTLVAVGESIYRGQNVEMTASAPQLRVVAGGTGSFIGARGQVTTTRNSDGTYRHEFILIND
jgi:hypothetical protein